MLAKRIVDVLFNYIRQCRLETIQIGGKKPQ
jgi:hypothetical protein